MGEPLPFEVLSMPEFISAEIKAGRLNLKAQSNGASVTYHDPCRLSRKGGVMQQPRDVLAALGLEVRETAAQPARELLLWRWLRRIRSKQCSGLAAKGI